MKRRDFTMIFSTSILAHLSCNRPRIDLMTKIKPTEQPTYENIIEYCTTFPYLSLPIPLLVETYNGVPFRVTENTSANTLNLPVPSFALASSYVLFDKHRPSLPVVKGKPIDKPSVFKHIITKFNETLAKGKKIAIITNYINSPYLEHLIREIKETNDQFLIIELPVFEFYKQQVQANEFLFSKNIYILPKIRDKKIIINFACDFLYNDPFSIYFLPQFEKQKQLLITFEDTLSLTGLNSKIRVSASETIIFKYAFSILKLILEKCSPLSNYKESEELNLDSIIELPENIIKEITNNLDSIVFICNPYYPMEIQLLTNLLNYICWDISKNHSEQNYYLIDLEKKSNQKFSYNTYLSNIDNFDLTLFVNYNPYYSLNKQLVKLIEDEKIKNIVQLSLYQNELTKWTDTFLPMQTFMEYWGDYQQIDGTILAQQKIIHPINKNSFSDYEFFFKLRNYLKSMKEPKDYSMDIMDWYTRKINHKDLEENLRNGIFLKPSLNKENKLELQKSKLNKIFSILNFLENKESSHRKLKIYPSLLMYSGEYSKNIYLYELPDPLTAVVWQSPVILSTGMIKEEGFTAIKIKFDNEEIKFPSLYYSNFEIQECFYIYRNYDYCKRLFNKDFPSINPLYVEFINSYYLNVLDCCFEKSTELVKLKRNSYLTELDMLSPAENDEPINFFEQPNTNLNVDNELQWAMIIDIDECIGCNLCMLACQIENNIPVVGEKNINRNRDLYWVNVLKLSSKERIYFLPLMCQHCDYAPCESVCPVGATSHSSDGINEMTYNRCIGSRFCMVNCPYDVRKFNFEHAEKVHIQYLPEIMNPLVTIRSRGVSEKCTFCIQRINFARRKEKLFGKSDDLTFQTACQTVCPTKAITFGKKKQLLQNEESHHLYVLLKHFNTHPNVFYKSNSYEQAKG